MILNFMLIVSAFHLMTLSALKMCFSKAVCWEATEFSLVLKGYCIVE